MRVSRWQVFDPVPDTLAPALIVVRIQAIFWMLVRLEQVAVFKIEEFEQISLCEMCDSCRIFRAHAARRSAGF